MTPLHRAAEECHEDLCEFLVSAGADINAEDKVRSLDCLIFLASDYRLNDGTHFEPPLPITHTTIQYGRRVASPLFPG
jgi:Ankyrin repeats (many copies)